MQASNQDTVLCRSFGDEPLVRIAWSTTKEGILITARESLRLWEEEGVDPVAVLAPSDAVYEYSEGLFRRLDEAFQHGGNHSDELERLWQQARPYGATVAKATSIEAETEPETVSEAVPEAVPEAMVETEPEAVSEAVPGVVVEAVATPEAVVEAVPEVIAATEPEATVYQVSPKAGAGAVSTARIKVIGLGGAGCNAVSRMVRDGVRSVECIAMNTDAQHLAVTEAALRVQLGEKITRGVGAGGNHILGRKAAEESRDEIKEVVAGTDIVFITAGMGGGTGTGSAPVVAEIAKQSGALTVAVVTRPFSFEGAHRSQVAEKGIANLIEKVDALIIAPNDRLLDQYTEKTSMDGAFKLCDEVLSHAVQAIAEVVTVPGLVNIDLADVRAVLKDAGAACISVGRGSGQNGAVNAVKEALSSQLVDVSMAGARSVLFNFTGSSTLTLFDVNNAAQFIRQTIDPEANIIFGVVIDPNMGEDVRLTMIATGFSASDLPPENDTRYNIVKRGDKWSEKGTHRNKSSISCARLKSCSARETPLESPARR